MIGIDFETYLISSEMPVPKPVCCSSYREIINRTEQLSPEEISGFLFIGHESMEAFLKEILESDQIIVAHNMKFEALVIYHWFPNLRKDLLRKLHNGELYCTKIYEQLLDNVRKKKSPKYSLDKLVDKYLGLDISESKAAESWRMRYSELDGVPRSKWPKEAVDYAIDDSRYAYKIAKLQSQVEMDYKLSVEAEFYLNLMGLNGILVDHNRALQLKNELLDKVVPMYKELEKLGLCEETEGKYKKKMNAFREHIKGLDIIHEYTIKGVVSTSGESLDRYAEQCDDKALRYFREAIKYEKILTAFAGRLMEADPLIRTEYNAVVSSGRTSSRSSKQFPSVNIQQMPRSVDGLTWDVRNCYIPREGYKICSIDYAGLELASTANQLYKTFGWSRMLDTINSGDSPVDLHSKFACRVKSIKDNRHITYEDFVSNKKCEGYKEIRQLCKPINLGFPGGIGYDNMRSLLIKEGVNTKFKVLYESSFEKNVKNKLYRLKDECPNLRIKRTEKRKYTLVYDELVGLKNTLFDLYPELERFLKEKHHDFLTGETKHMKNEFGEWEAEPMYAFEIDGFRRDWCTYTEFCNGYLMQSPSAIGAKKAMNHIIAKYFDSNVVTPLAFIHDEIVFEVLDNQEMPAIIKDISQIMIEEMQSVLPNVRVTTEAEVFDYWKKAGGFYEATYWKDPGGSINGQT